MTTILRDGPQGVTLRPLAPEDLPAARSLSATLRWPHRKEDWAALLRTGEGLAAESEGRLIGTILAWRMGADASRVGMLIAEPPLQDTPTARRLLETMIGRLAPRRVLVNATTAQLPLFAELGFAPVEVVRLYQGASFSIGLVPPPPGCRLRPVGRRDHPVLAALDAAATGLPRPAVIAALLKGAKGVVLDRDGAVEGFALLRRFGHGHVIGPVVAPDLDTAKALIGHWLGACQGQFMRLDVPAGNGLPAWLEGLGLEAAGIVTGMALGAAPAAAPAGPSSTPGMFALAGQTLG